MTMKKPETPIEAYDLDMAIKAGTAGTMIGKRAANGVGIIGIITRLGNGKIAIRVRVKCECRRKRQTLYLVSGIHAGAFCCTADIEGNRSKFNLRDNVVVCNECGA